MTSFDLSVFLPEIIWSIYLMIALMAGVFIKGDLIVKWIYNATTIGLIGMGILYLRQAPETVMIFNDLLVDDGFGRYLKALIFITSGAVLASSVRYLQRVNMFVIEFPILVGLAVLGMALMVMANNLLALYIGIELQSLALYVLAAFRRDNLRSSEAGLKYFVLGALSSGLLLFGMSFIYGFTGTLDYAKIASLMSQTPGIGIVVGLALMATALAFKLSAAPFHMWTPDVYQGAPTAVTSLFASAPKIAVAGMFARMIYTGFGDALPAWQQILVVLALLSVFIGGIGGIGQKNIKRMLAYSSILNMGFVLLALSAGSLNGLHAMLIYLTIYACASVGIFACIMSAERDGREALEISDFGMLSTRAPLVAAGFAVLLFSTAGIPPLAGFLAKYVALQAAMASGLAWLAILAVIASVIGAFYYLRIIYYMYFGEEPHFAIENRWGWGQAAVFAISALLMIAWMFNFFGIDALAARAVESLAL